MVARFILLAVTSCIAFAEYKYRRQTVYGMTDLVPEMENEQIGSLITNPRYLGVVRFNTDVSNPQVDIHVSFEQKMESRSEYLWVVPYYKLLEVNNDIQDCQDRMQLLEDNEKVALMDDTTNEKCTERDIGGGRVRVTCDFALAISISYPPEKPASINLPDLEEAISVPYPFEIFFALANCQRTDKLRAEYRISVDRQIGFMRYYYFADVPDASVKVAAKYLSIISLFLSAKLLI